MSTKMLRVKLSELRRFRIVHSCQQGVVEVPVDKLNAALGSQGECRLCSVNVLPLGTDSSNPLRDLMRAIAAINSLGPQMSVEVEITWPDQLATQP